VPGEAGIEDRLGSRIGYLPSLLLLVATAESLDGERKTITVLCTDIKGSTELMRDLHPEEARAIVDSMLKLRIDSLHRYDGYVAKSTFDRIFCSARPG
jgi:class 3 adenylate cyclase